jgi:hypothetical protein
LLLVSIRVVGEVRFPRTTLIYQMFYLAEGKMTMKKVLNKTSATGCRGILIDSFDGHYHFRVYDVDHNFKDYLVRHCDLEITLHDQDATFYEYEDGTMTLDHSMEVTGEKDD